MVSQNYDPQSRTFPCLDFAETKVAIHGVCVAQYPAESGEI